MKLNSRVERIRFIKFLIVGTISSIVDFGFLNLFTLVFHWSLIVAQALSFLLAVINSYTWNHYWTYPDSRSKSIWQQFFQFVMVNLVGIGIRTVLISSLNGLFINKLSNISILGLSDQVLSQNLALACSVIVVMVWNYFINRYWTFNDAGRQDPIQS